MENSESTELGMNRTGAKISPLESVKTAEGAQNLTVPSPGNINGIHENRIRYIRDADPIGTVPMPATLSGAFAALQEKIMNGDHTFMDKLGERIAFERTGSRLYEALISKYEGSEETSGFPELTIIQNFYQEERRHFEMLCECMEEIGGDATAMTPSADVAGVAAMGWVQVMTDPRISFKDSLEIILQAELVDNACWETLIELAEDVGLSKLANRFQEAADEEAIHLSTIKEWVKQFNLSGKTEALEQ